MARNIAKPPSGADQSLLAARPTPPRVGCGLKGKRMAKIPPSIAELLVTGFRVAVSEADPVFLGLMLERPTGETRFLLTRQQVVDLAQSLSEAAEKMPKPS